MTQLKGKIIEATSRNPSDITDSVGASLKRLRKLSGLTQLEMAKRLDIGQAAVSKIEGRGDIHISTLEKFVEALGAKLKINASFPSSTQLALTVKDAFDIVHTDDSQLVFPIFGDDEFKQNRDVVLSIRPQYSEKIIAGTKTVELRRRFPVAAPSGTTAYIYSTSPVRAMVGMADIKRVLKMPVKEIWAQFEKVACIEKDAFDQYFDGVENGFALQFENIRALKEPLPLTELRQRFGFEPPQSFLYAKHDLRRALNNEFAVIPH